MHKLYDEVTSPHASGGGARQDMARPSSVRGLITMIAPTSTEYRYSWLEYLHIVTSPLFGASRQRARISYFRSVEPNGSAQ